MKRFKHLLGLLHHLPFPAFSIYYRAVYCICKAAIPLISHPYLFSCKISSSVRFGHTWRQIRRLVVDVEYRVVEVGYMEAGVGQDPRKINAGTALAMQLQKVEDSRPMAKCSVRTQEIHRSGNKM